MAARVAGRRCFGVTMVVALVGALMAAACTGQAPPAEPPPSSASPTGPAERVPSGGSVAGLAGWLYYYSYPELYRLTPAGLELVLRAPHATVSPDGLQIAYVDDAGELIVTDRDGGQARSVLSDVIGLGFEPSWSADSQWLLVARSLGGGSESPVFGKVDVASGEFTPLRSQIEGIHPLWSADGRRMGYATGTCELMVADADGSNQRMVPVIGNPDPAVNPQRWASCDPYSISPDGSMMAIARRVLDQPMGDIGRDLAANVVIDTRTGAEVPLPVPGQIWAALFLPDGGVLVRSTNDGGATVTLTLLDNDLTVTAQVPEPAAAGANPCGQSAFACGLLAYTPN